MIWRSFEEIRKRESELQRRIYDILNIIIKIKSYAFHGIVFKEVKWEWEIDGRRADIVVLDSDGHPFLIIETKRKLEARDKHKSRGSFHVTDRAVIGQAISYAALAKRRGLKPQFIATCNPIQIAVFRVPEDIDRRVNWYAIDRREYENVVPPDLYYELVYGRSRVDTRDLELSESFFTILLDDLASLVKEVRKVDEIAPLTYKVIRDLRGFVTWLAYVIEPIVRSCYTESRSHVYSNQLIKELERMKREKGYSPTPEQLAKEMAYIFMNKLIFYKILERYWGGLPKLKPLLSQGVRNAIEYLDKLSGYFMEAVKVTKNFEPIFVTGIYDLITLPDDPEVLRGIDEFIEYLERLSIEKFSDVIGYVYEELIPAEERHILGQFYTPPPIAELIVRWCIRSPNDTVLDPGCGSGTFLVQAYKWLHYLKTGKRLEEVRYPKKEIHEKILEQLYAIDINEFPAHLTAINLAMRNPRAPSTKMNVIVSDFFLVTPCQRVLLPYRVKVLGSEKESKIVHIPRVDCVVGNPPYTRWTEIPGETQDRILGRYRDQMAKYDLVPQVGKGVEPGIYVYWIMHAKEFLKDGGRLGMIISDSWLQADYGIKFGRFLLDNFKIKAIIDISARVFPVPLIGTCIVLLERCDNPKLRDENNVVFMYLRSEEKIDIDRILNIVDTASRGGVAQSRVEKNCIVKVVKQRELRDKNVKWISFLLTPEEFIWLLGRSELIIPLTSIFEPCRGNTYWSYWALKHGKRPDVGGEEFFYLSTSDVQRYRIPQEYLYPLIPSTRYLKFFTFREEDWKALEREGVECYLFLAHKPRHELPEVVRKYIMLGEGPHAQIRLRRRRGEEIGRPVSESLASQTRKRYKQHFHDWYDLGGTIEAPIYATYGARYWIRFVLAQYRCALDHRILALIPKQGVEFNELELKALLAYLNSSFSQLQAEIKGRTAGGVALIELDVKPLSEFLVLNVKKLHEKHIERLAELFDRLEEEARKMGGADAVENVFGSELARELTSREVRPGIKGLWNTVIREIDYEIARILGLEEAVESLRTVLLELIKRRLARAREAKPGALRGSEELPIIRKEEKEEKKRTSRRKAVNPKNLTLDVFFKRE